MRVLVAGKRQSGKTTFAREHYPALPCVEVGRSEEVLKAFEENYDVVVCCQSNNYDQEILSKSDVFVFLQRGNRQRVKFVKETDK